MSESIFDQFRRKIGDPKAFRERLQRYGRNSQFALRHLEEWRLQYPDSWVGVYDEKLVAVAKDRDDLVAVLKAKQVPLEGTFVRFITKEKYAIIVAG
jgi:hypothetical protein